MKRTEINGNIDTKWINQLSAKQIYKVWFEVVMVEYTNMTHFYFCRFDHDFFISFEK